MFYGSDHVIDAQVIYICLDVDPFLFLSTSFLACQSHNPCLFDPKKGRGKIYFKADLILYFCLKSISIFKMCNV